ncbi:MAG: hypothetical protein SVM80_04895 [Halobacteriota archaeon]|nr:hypothetical protein [Halobacteriota archaeon]
MISMCGWDFPEENEDMKNLIGKRVKEAYCLKPYRDYNQYVIEFDDGSKIVWRYAEDACDVEFTSSNSE